MKDTNMSASLFFGVWWRQIGASMAKSMYEFKPATASVSIENRKNYNFLKKDFHLWFSEVFFSYSNLFGLK